MKIQGVAEEMQLEHFATVDLPDPTAMPFRTVWDITEDVQKTSNGTVWVTQSVPNDSISTAKIQLDAIITNRIADDQVPNAKLAKVAGYTFKANSSPGVANPQDITIDQARSLLFRAPDIFVFDAGASGVFTPTGALRIEIEMVGGGSGGGSAGQDANNGNNSFFGAASCNGASGSTGGGYSLGGYSGYGINGGNGSTKVAGGGAPVPGSNGGSSFFGGNGGGGSSPSNAAPNSGSGGGSTQGGGGFNGGSGGAGAYVNFQIVGPTSYSYGVAAPSSATASTGAGGKIIVKVHYQ